MRTNNGMDDEHCAWCKLLFGCNEKPVRRGSYYVHTYCSGYVDRFVEAAMRTVEKWGRPEADDYEQGYALRERETRREHERQEEEREAEEFEKELMRRRIEEEEAENELPEPEED